MKLRKRLRFGNSLKRMLSLLVSLCLMATILPLAAGVAAAETTASMITDYQPTINEVIDASGFKHPGVGLTKDILENMRTQVREQKEPWNTYFNQMLLSSAAARNVGSNNQGADPMKPASDAFNSQGFNGRFIADGLKAYTQAILYVVTGDETYRANAMHIIRIWSQMDPAKYVYFTDAHIHTGIPLNRMVTAAEILKYTSTQTEELKWTDKDTTDFTTNLITPVIETFQHTNYRFMNQHLYPLIGAMAGYIFTGNKDRYNEGVEWFTVNKTAVDQGQNGAIKQLFRLVDKNDLTGETVNPPVVQHVEMGRDQAHGAGDVTNAEILARLLLAQETKVDPVVGTVSTAPNAVGPYEFLNDRILDAAEYFAKFMIGYDTPWIPVAAHTDVNGNPTIIYKELSQQYRGRLTQNTWELFYYYKYVKGINMEERAPYFTQMFADRVFYNWDGVDGGGDFWLFIPKAAEAEGTKYLVKTITEPLREIEDRYTAFDSNSTTKQEGDTSFAQIKATEAGSKIALVGAGTGEKTIGFRIRTNGVAKLEMSYSINDTLTLPDTKGQWRYVTYKMNDFQGFGDLAYFKVIGAGTKVDIDHLNYQAGTLLTPPVFSSGNKAVHLFTYAGSQATINYDFSATDASATDVVTYQIDNKPEGVVFNESTGAFSWKPTQAGTYSFVVGASDGTTVTAKDVIVVVTNDRQSTVSAVIAPYNANISYISSTLDNYNRAYADVMNLISSASDDVFYQKLSDLNNAVEGLQLLTPLLSDGSMDYSNMFVSSTFGTQLPNLLDNYAGSFAGYYLAQNLSYFMDFGPNNKVSANAFGLQVRASFPERVGGTAIFGSNDRVNWTRLTPGLTTVTEDMQTLEVQDDLKNQEFRYLKIQMIQPSSTMIELSEFRIFGERHEMVDKIPGTIAEALAEAAKLPAENYTKQSYYLFQKELEYVKNAVGNPDYTEQELINEIYDARSLLVPYMTSLYSLEGNAKNTFGFSSSTDGTVFGTAAYAPGKVGQGISLNGTDGYVMLPASHPMSAYNEITLATWVYWNGSSQWQRIFDFGNNTNQYMFLTPKSGSNKLLFDIKNGSSEQSVETAQLPANQWVHVAVTLGNGTAKLYVGGALKATKSGFTIKPSDLQPGTNYIGKSQFADPLFNGMIDEFRVYNRVLSDAEIGAVYNQPGNGADKSLLTFLLDQAAAAGNAGIYTADSVQALQQAIPGAQAVASDSGASQAQVDTAADSLRTAYEGLVYLPGVPAIAPVMDKAVIAGNQLAFKLHQLNSVAGTIFSVSGLPQGAVFDADKRTVVWIPDRTQGGVYTVTLTAATNGGTTSRTVKITVKGQPVIASNETVELMSKQAFTYQVRATDPTGATLTYSAAKLPSGAALNSVTGVFTWTPAHANYGDNFVTFIVSNGLYKISQTVDFKVNLGMLKPDGYTKGSYYLYEKEFKRIQAALALPGADKAALVAQLAQAEAALVSTITLTAPKVDVTSSMVVASTVAWPNASAGSAAVNGWRAFDGNTGTYTDTTANPSWILIDLGEGNAKSIGSLRFYPRSNFVPRINGSIIQGSGDGTNWTDLYTINGIGALAWNSGVITNTTAFRYLRFYSPGGSSNVAELEFYEKPIDRTLINVLNSEIKALNGTQYAANQWQALQNALDKMNAVPAAASQEIIDAATADVIAALKALPPVTTAAVSPAQPDGLNGWYVHAVTVSLNVYDNLSGTAKTEYSLDGGHTWRAYTSALAFDKDDKYTVSYRSTDNAGNAEEAKIISFNLDATLPAITVSGVVYGTFNDSGDMTPIIKLSDNLSGVDGSKTTVTLDTYGIQQGATIPLYTLPLGSHTLVVTASDLAGNTNSQTIMFQTTTSIQSLQALVTRFINMGWIDNPGIAKSLQSKLAANNLPDFVNEVQAQSSKHISAQAADYLLRDAKYLSASVK
ncbi:LamG-like jellyroll fold domain-containing protein [Paenibacillus sp. V4I7]|uniref:LamG-like jellyroll fold domain-containing protein n=1 Tax=Paenibacillus sp. V4I7 TaxID=3042307 RepID=UPI00278273CC|nr:LamG-like jellyroll fold domain-containing protein [Paenibacillus sp. V4I7]MDQ0897847.1 hypothetical protein [Paenibacillus sp. V4I7]